jgi:oleandomycin transport system ATP-binding protein
VLPAHPARPPAAGDAEAERETGTTRSFSATDLPLTLRYGPAGGNWQRFVRDLTAGCRSISGMNVADVPYAVEARGLVKRFGKTTALAGVDLTARAGTVLGLLGPNGAGKTTAVRILATLLRPDAGEAYVCGYNAQRDAHQVRQLIGLTGQYASVDEGLSGTNNLIMIGRLLGLGRPQARARAAELLARFELADAAGRRAKTYSGGLRRRLDLAASLVGRPRVLFLDEPTTGLDPHSRNEVWAMIREMVADGTTVLLTTQYLEEADQLAHDIAVINHGLVIATGTPDELKAQAGRQVLEVTPAHRGDVDAVTALLEARLGAAPEVSAESGTVSAAVENGRLLPEIVRELDAASIELAEFALRKASLDEVFLALTGQPAETPDPSATPELNGSPR